MVETSMDERGKTCSEEGGVDIYTYISISLSVCICLYLVWLWVERKIKASQENF